MAIRCFNLAILFGIFVRMSFYLRKNSGENRADTFINNMVKTKSFILSDESVNTHGFRLLLSGADLDQFRRNPVMFYDHNEWDSPIGRWENIRIEGEKLMADPVFDMEDEDAVKIAGKVERGFLRAASIGLRIIEQSDAPEVLLPGQTRPTVTKWRLREASIVAIGANHNALRLYDENDNLMTDEQILKLFDNSGVKVVAPKNSEKMKLDKVFNLLDLANDSTDEQLHDAVKKVMDENKQLKDAQAAREKADKEALQAEAAKLVDEAVKDGRLNADGKGEMLKFFETDFEAAKKTLLNIPKRQSVKKEIENKENQNNTELADLNAKSWDELDKSGKLAVLKEKYPDVYKEKFKAKFGKEPENV